MLERTFLVKYISLKKCFCYLSDKHAKAIKQGSTIKLTLGSNSCYFTLGDFLSNLAETEIGINTVYAKSLGFKDNESVNFSVCNNVPGIKRVNITPNSKDDYEILELMAENVQSTLLNQVRLVHNNQKIVIWLSNSLNAVVDVDGVEPVSPGRLDQLTEVVIKPPVPRETKEKDKGNLWNIDGFLKYFKSTKKAVGKKDVQEKYREISFPLVFRLFPLNSKNKNNVFNVYTFEEALPSNVLHELRHDNLFLFRPIVLSKDINYFEDTSHESILVRLNVVNDQTVNGFDQTVKVNGIDYFIPLFVDEQILNHYNVNVGSKVILLHTTKTTEINKLEILCDRNKLKDVGDEFKIYVSENTREKPLVLNSNFMMNVSSGIEERKVLLRFTPNVKYCLIDGDFIRNTQIVTNEYEIVDCKNKCKVVEEKFCLDCCNFNEIIDGCVKCLSLGYEDRRRLENVVISGKPGTGKTTITKAFSSIISSKPYYVHVETVNCKAIKGKSLDSLHKFLTNVFLKLIYYQPSVLVLDDLHVICEKVPEGDQPTQETLLFNKTSEMLADLLSHYHKNNFIQILATSESTLKLNQNIFASRGIHLFKNVYNVKEFDKVDRIKFLTHAFSCKSLTVDDDVEIEDLSLKTEGYVAQDLLDFVDKCAFESIKENPKNDAISANHCVAAFNSSSSLSLRDVRLHSPGDRDFSDVGGLDEIKSVLTETMLWPAKYSNIFANAPLRLQSGLLLYGPPGTGKTILAGAAAKQYNLRLISIKGPELLSKYIGASEQAVRDVFQKAQSAKPCILFFDEFDSLAPRRGHDNTGVTDRVVNQFLTQLDGVEALTGVCVLAATSRPDLLDPALLRPGRLDRQLYCPLPDEPSRLSILKSLSKKLNFSKDVDLTRIASDTEGFSGADLQGVLYTAQLNSVEHLIDGEVDDYDGADFEPEITHEHLQEALRSTRPSLTREERLKYDRIYAKFEGKGLDLKSGKQMATLA